MMVSALVHCFMQVVLLDKNKGWWLFPKSKTKMIREVTQGIVHCKSINRKVHLEPQKVEMLLTKKINPRECRGSKIISFICKVNKAYTWSTAVYVLSA